MRATAILTLSILLIGCGTNPASQPSSATTPQIAFSEVEFQPWAGNGNANIRGQAFLTTKGGFIRTCAGQHVILVPNNPYTALAVAKAIHAGATGGGVPVDPKLEGYLRSSVCDAEGNFSFEAVRSGTSWMILAPILWLVPTGYGSDPQGGILVEAVAAAPGENRFILADSNLAISWHTLAGQ
jgi:hypothetical protein